MFMDGFQGIYAIWLREFKVYLREKERAVASFISPLLWIFGFGIGLGASVSIAGTSYQLFILPGVIAMSILFTSVFYGIYVIWDRKLDFLKEVLVSPTSRTYVFIGKMLGGVTDAMIQTSMLFIIAVVMGISFTPYSFLVSVAAIFMIAACMTGLGLIFGAILSSIESFQLISQFVIWPLFFFSGALFPLENLPPWLSSITYFDPITYGVDALRGTMLGMAKFPFYIDFGAMLLFLAATVVIGSLAFRRMGKL
jgi:ABC-2 type transport system permease protein